MYRYELFDIISHGENHFLQVNHREGKFSYTSCIRGCVFIQSIPDESKTFTRLMGCGIKIMQPIFKSKIRIYQSKAELDEKVLFGKITHLQDPTIRKMPIKSLYRNRKFHVPFWSVIYMALKFILPV